MEAHPLHWPRGKQRSKHGQYARFKTSFAHSRDGIMRQISLLGGKLPIISTNIPLRRDGLPYASQKEPEDSGVAVYFTLKNTQMCFACDCWEKVADNMQAIHKTIEAIRGIERWGSKDMLEAAFTGFQALPSPDAKREWWVVLGVDSKCTMVDAEGAYKKKAKQAHPDNGGSHEAMAELNEAVSIMRKTNTQAPGAEEKE